MVSKRVLAKPRHIKLKTSVPHEDTQHTETPAGFPTTSHTEKAKDSVNDVTHSPQGREKVRTLALCFFSSVLNTRR